LELKAQKGGKARTVTSSTEAQIEGYKKMISGLIRGHERKNEYIRELQRKLGMKNPNVVRKRNVPKESAKPAKGNSPKTYALVPASKAKRAGKKPNKAAPKKGKTSPLNPTAASFKPKKAAPKKVNTSPKAVKTSPKAKQTLPKDPKEMVKELLRQNAELQKKNEGQREFIRNSKAFMKKVQEEKVRQRN